MFRSTIGAAAFVVATVFLTDSAHADDIFAARDICMSRHLDNYSLAVDCGHVQYNAKAELYSLTSLYGRGDERSGIIYACAREWGGGYGAVPDRAVDWEMALHCAQGKLTLANDGRAYPKSPPAPGHRPIAEDVLSGVDTLCAQSWKIELAPRARCVADQRAAAAKVLNLNTRLSTDSPAHRQLTSCIKEWEWGYLVVDWIQVEDCLGPILGTAATKPALPTQIPSARPAAPSTSIVVPPVAAPARVTPATTAPATPRASGTPQRLLSKIVYPDREVVPHQAP